MNCHDFDQRIQQLLDERRPLGGDADLHGHALSCSNCEATLAAYGVLLRGVKQLRQPALGAGFAPQVVAAVQGRSHARSGRERTSSPVRWFAPLAAVAALALLAVGIGSWANWSRNRAAGPGAVADSAADQPVAGAPRWVVGISLPGRVGQGRPGAEAPIETETATTDRPRLVGSPAPLREPAGDGGEYYGYRTAIESLAMQLPGAVDQFESMELYAPGIRPIRESFSTAFETLLKTLPGHGDSSEPKPPQASLLLYDAVRLA